jgi:multidrug efflux system outer membrane protein
MRKLLLVPLAAALLGACTVTGPNYERPAIDLPDQWSGQANTNAAAPRTPEKWWTVFGDAALDALVEEALAANRDLAAAAARVEAARAGVTIADADRYPSVGATAGRSRTRSTQRGAVPLFPGVPVESNNMRGVVSASYEVDFWGRYARAGEAARAELLASQAGRDALRLSLTGDVAKGWFAIASIEAQRKVAQRTFETRQELVQLQTRRFEAGIGSEFEVRQVEAERDNARVSLINLVRERETEDARLAVLLGRSPRDAWQQRIAQSGDGAANNAAPLAVPEGLPSELLIRRPDLRDAEARLIAANARIGAARAAFFPSIALTGYLGTESAALSNLFSGPALIWQLAASLTQPIWNAGRLDAQLEAATARQKEALANYEKSVQGAFADVRIALAAHTAARDTVAAQAQRGAALAQALKLARLRFDNGISSLIDVLDAERNLLGAELARIEAIEAQRAAVADLIKALGGGWVQEARG